MHLCIYVSEDLIKTVHLGDECEDVGMGWVCSREVAGALGTLLTEEGKGGDA